MPYLKLKNSVFCPLWSVFSIKHGLSLLFPIKNTGFPCSILNMDQHGQYTEFFSLKYGSPYIDLNLLEKNFGSVFFAFLAVNYQHDDPKKQKRVRVQWRQYPIRSKLPGVKNYSTELNSFCKNVLGQNSHCEKTLVRSLDQFLSYHFTGTQASLHMTWSLWI